jgi:hypothetical protein
MPSSIGPIIELPQMWWLLPLGFSVAVVLAAAIASRSTIRPTYADGIVVAFMWCAAVICILLAWLIWAVLT